MNAHDNLSAEIARLMPLSNSHELAARFGMAHSTVLRIARKAGVQTHKRGQPSLGVKSIWNAHKLRWPFQPRNQRALEWAA